MINIPHNGSSLRRVHTATGVLRQALDSLPTWVATYAALERLSEARAGTNVAPVAENVAALVLDAVRAGKPVPSDIEEQAGRVVLQLHSRQGVLEGLQRANGELAGDLDVAVMNGKAKVYGYLNDQLSDVYAAATELGDATGLLASEDVLAARRIDDHEAWTVLARRYAELRSAQATLDQALDAPLAGVISPATEAKAIRSVDSLTTWLDWRTHGYVVNGHGLRQPLSSPWPIPSTSEPLNLKLSEASSPEFLAWAVDSQVDLWVPSPAQLVEEQERLARVLRAYREEQEPKRPRRRGAAQAVTR